MDIRLWIMCIRKPVRTVILIGSLIGVFYTCYTSKIEFIDSYDPHTGMTVHFYRKQISHDTLFLSTLNFLSTLMESRKKKPQGELSNIVAEIAVQQEDY